MRIGRMVPWSHMQFDSAIHHYELDTLQAQTFVGF